MGEKGGAEAGPVGRIPGQAGDRQPHHQADLPEPDLGDQPLEAGASAAEAPERP